MFDYLVALARIIMSSFRRKLSSNNKRLDSYEEAREFPRFDNMDQILEYKFQRRSVDGKPLAGLSFRL